MPFVRCRKQTGHHLHPIWVVVGGGERAGDGDTSMPNPGRVQPGMSAVWANLKTRDSHLEGCSVTSHRRSKARALKSSAWQSIPRGLITVAQSRASLGATPAPEGEPLNVLRPQCLGTGME